MIVVTHELPSIHAIADDVVLIANGGVRFAGTLADAIADPNPDLRRFFDREPDPPAAPGASLYDALAPASAP